MISRRANNKSSDGLGLRGALAINLSGGFVLAMWLLFGSLDVPIHGKIAVTLFEERGDVTDQKDVPAGAGSFAPPF